MENELLTLFEHAGRLKSVIRLGWQLKGIENVESVTDHSFRVAFMAWK